MDIHPPQKPVRSLRDFLVHLLTVIIGILIALSLEGLLERRHHRALVQEARTNLAAEMNDNRQLLERGLSMGPDAIERLKHTIDLVRAFRTGNGPSQSDVDWSFGLISLSSTAWTTAASTGTLGHMDYAEVRRYTGVYALQKEFSSIQQQTLGKWLDLQRWSLRLDPKLGFSHLTNAELSEIEDAAAAALIHTQTEASFARSLTDEYRKILRGK